MLRLVTEADCPEDAVERVLRKGGSPYIIRVKCMGCPECPFRPYVKPVIEEGRLRIGEYSYPIRTLEKITIRYKERGFETEEKIEEIYYVSSRYLKGLIIGETRNGDR